MPPPGERVRLGRSDVTVTRLGLGAAPLGGLYEHVPDRQARDVVTNALALGVHYIDTAPFYGHGVAESRVGDALSSSWASQVTVSTKVGRRLVPADDEIPGSDIFMDRTATRIVWDFSADGVRASLQESLDRLDLEHVDIVYIHDPENHETPALEEALPALCAMRDQGLIGAVGVGTNFSDLAVRFAETGLIDVVLLAGRWTLLDRTGQACLDRCLELDVPVVLGGIFNSGILADPRPGTHFEYEVAQPQYLNRAMQMALRAQESGLPLSTAALQHAFRHPAVTSVLVGARSATEVTQAVSAFAAEVPEQLWRDLDDLALDKPHG
jgi:D-threo-aldose 1-dehydrogenase